MALRPSHYPYFGLRGWLLLASLSVAATSVGASTCRVDALGGGNGSAWNATRTLQGALSTITCNEVWVKAGTYTPTSGVDRTISFNIPPGVRVYGGFAGTETVRSARDPAANVTTLSGEIGAAGIADNSLHVVYMDGTTGFGSVTSGTVLDGFTISGGNGADTDEGGALYCDGHGAGHACSPTISNVTFSGNSANYGGAIYNDGYNFGNSSPILTNVTFKGNTASSDGGAIYIAGYSNGHSSPIFTNVTFNGNSGSDGGAMASNGTSGGDCSPILTNVTFYGNSAFRGGALYDGFGSTTTLNNVIAWDDFATSDAPEIYNEIFAYTYINHSVIHGSGGSGGWNSSVGVDQGNNLDADPMLDDLANNGGSTLTQLPGAGSSAIDTGNDATCPGTDQRGVSRLQGPHCDIGAVEVLNPHIFTDGFESP